MIVKTFKNISFDDYIINHDFESPEFQLFLKSIDVIVIGKKTFETVIELPTWPFHHPVFVLSTSISNTPHKFKDKAKILNGTPKNIVNYLKSKGYKNLFLDGEITITGFFKDGLIDELFINSVADIVGEGISDLCDFCPTNSFSLFKTVILNDDSTLCHFVRK